ncbi:OmpA family protein [Cupriavidus sp. YR651]|uniref:OmpA family protein n=1 Tax=Cupriavidus sp. YR651 TaxID=1855315 RepID=UPI0008879ACF|nr:OmpA family protein [Cupriavidus sp. YR651]SDC63676.1 OmpA family protein [Cupriavidus sp. YR651]
MQGQLRMPTTSRAMSFVRSKTWAVFLLGYLAQQAAFGCSPVRGLDLTFANESAALDSAAALRLGDWVADLKAAFPNYENFSVFGHVAASERGGKRLAEERAAAVRRFLTDRGFRADRVYAEQPGASYNVPIPGQPARAVAIDFLPACPHQCCTLPSHRAEDKGLPMP